MAELKLADGAKVVVTTTDKFFQKGDLGRSAGSEETLEFALVLKPEDGPADVTRAILEVRRVMDERVLIAEYLRGALNGAQLKMQREVLLARYAKMLGTPDESFEEEGS